MKYIYIHGASATSQSFNYIRERVKGDSLLIDYHSSDGFEQNLEDMSNVVSSLKNVFMIAHSLGGIYALHLANRFPELIRGAVTISTPYGGSNTAEIAKWFMPHTQLFKDIAPSGRIIRKTMDLPVLHPWTQIVTIDGNSPWMISKNDGVVTHQSMRARPDMELVELDLNHYEVVQSPLTVDIIRDRIRLLSR
jgi:pimeloyl-ACP methyl ester carboxylesterase